MVEFTESISDSEIRQTIFSLLESLKSENAMICPSQVPRMLQKEGKLNGDWRDYMDLVRDVVWELVEEGEVEVTQRGQVMDRDARGPIRVRRKRY